MSSHNHSRGLETHQSNLKALLMVLLITVIVMLVEIIGGYFSGSLALLSDAGHMFTDCGALTLSFFALWFSRKAADKKQTFGFYRTEILAALLNGSLLIFIAAFIFYGAILRILHPVLIKGLVMLVVAMIGLLANIVGVLILSKNGAENLNVKSARWHIISDALSSAGVVLGGIVIWLTGFSYIDPIISIFISLIILRGALGIVSESVNVLLEAVPSDIDLEKLVEKIKGKNEGIRDVHDIHVWTITSGLRALSAHILIKDLLISKCGDISGEIKEILKKEFRIEHATLEFECESCKSGLICRIKQNHKSAPAGAFDQIDINRKE